jgi:hypothetical protein
MLRGSKATTLATTLASNRIDRHACAVILGERPGEHGPMLSLPLCCDLSTPLSVSLLQDAGVPGPLRGDGFTQPVFSQ